MKAKKEVDQMQPGELLEVISTDPGSLPDFKGWAQTSKTAVLKEQRTEKEGATDLYIHVPRTKVKSKRVINWAAARLPSSTV